MNSKRTSHFRSCFTYYPTLISVVSLLLATVFLNRAQEPGKGSIPLLQISPSWKNPATATIGLPSLFNGVVRFATDDAIYEGPPQFVRPSIRSGMWIPDGNETYTFFQRDEDRLNYDLLADTEGMPFVGRTREGKLGIYHTTPSRVERSMVKPQTPIPGGNGSFTRFRFPSAVGEVLAFIGYGVDNFKGVYRADRGSLVKVADVNTVAPGTEQRFHDFSYARVTPNGGVAFTGISTEGSGIYYWQNGELKPWVNKSVREPVSSAPYAGALLIGMENGWAYFTSFGPTLSIGRIQMEGGSIETLVSERDFSLQQGESLGAINYASVDHSKILFEAATHGAEFNLYLWEQGRVRALVRRGDEIDGKKIVSVRSGLQSLSGNRFVCLVDLQGKDSQEFARGVFLGELNPNKDKDIAVAQKSQAERGVSGWFKLGRAPIPVFARSTNQLEIPLPASPPR